MRQSMEAQQSQELPEPFQGLSLNSLLCFLSMCEEALRPFEGFLLPREGGIFLQLPRLFLRRFLHILSGAALKVTLYIFDQTWGWLDYDRKQKLTLDEICYGRKKADGTRIDEGTGLSENTARNALAEAEQAGAITVDIDNRDRGRIAKYYGIHVRHLPEEERERLTKRAQTAETEVRVAPLDLKKRTPGPQKAHPRGSKGDPRTEERTLERNSLKETTRKNSDAQRTEQELTAYALSLPSLAQRISIDEFRNFPWSPEALLAGLAHSGVTVPDGEAIKATGDEALLAWWQQFCWQPACWMMKEMERQHENAEQAWRKYLHRHARGMTDKGAPSWFASKRTLSSPILPWHMVGRNKATGELTGTNWRAVAAELAKENWWPNGPIPYDGPLLLDYSAGYSGTAPVALQVVVESLPPPLNNAIEVTAGIADPPRITRKLEPLAENEESQVVEEQPRAAREQPQPRRRARLPAPASEKAMAALQVAWQGLSQKDADALRDQIWVRYPAMSIGYEPLDDGSMLVGLEYAQDQWLKLRCFDDWLCPAPVNQRRITAAIAFGDSLNSRAGGESNRESEAKT